MPLELVKAFCVIIARHTSQRREIERALLILELMKFNPSETARRLGCNREKTYRWYHRVNKLLVLLSEHPEMTENLGENIHTVSVDEKTGIQALERINPDKNALPGSVAKLEFEYKRHSTQALIPSFEVGTGKIIAHHIGATRTSEDFVSLIEDTVNIDTEGTWIFVADQLNTHKSEELVKLIAEKLDIKDDLGEKGKSGILKNLESRELFLADKSHRIRFLYTPKHCSWMNQIEIWFGILTRKILRYGNFKSIDELRERIESFIEYYNLTMAKAFKWTYKGKLLQA